MKGSSENCRVVAIKCLDITSLLVGRFEGTSKVCWDAVSDLARHPFGVNAPLGQVERSTVV